jgi:flagellar basal body P-ring formation protein FlgA
MKEPPMTLPTAIRCTAALALSLAAPLSAQVALADHASLDAIVDRFLSAQMVQPAVARAPIDRRLRLRACSSEPVAAWHGAPGRVVQLACPGSAGWRIYVNLAASSTPAARAPAVKRGDALTVSVTGQGFAIRRSAEALESGVVGEWIAVRTSAGAEPLRARIIQPGLAEIPLP